MAIKKVDVLVKITTSLVEPINIWADEPARAIADILTVEGVAKAVIPGKGSPIYVSVDPRYDTAEVAAEIEGLLTATGPDIFKEE